MKLKNVALKLKIQKDKNIIPNHFEPFEQKNNKIIFGYLVDKLYKKNKTFQRTLMDRQFD